LLTPDLRQKLFKGVFLPQESGSVFELQLVGICLGYKIADLFFQASVYHAASRERAIEGFEQLGLAL
jgi:hypothetical protein